MRISTSTCRQAVLSGAVALALATPLAAGADEPLRLDASQLDGVTAGAFTGAQLSGESNAFGTVFSSSNSTLRLTSTSTPITSATSGAQTNVAVGIGGVETPPTATTVSQVDDIQGQRVWIIPIHISGGGPGFQWSASAVGVAAVSSEFPIF